MGDDIWNSLFFDLFYKFFLFLLFNVMDFYIVDNGVIEYLVLELKENDWDVFIGYFFGVDYCGYKFGFNYFEMVVKFI